MKTTHSVILLAVAFLSAAPAIRGAEAPTKAEIVIGFTPGDDKSLADAASALGRILKEMTGKEPALVPGDDGQATVLLTLAGQTPVAHPAMGKLTGMKREAYALATPAPGKLLIAGNSGKAVLDGVYDLLGELGCRWLTPGKNWRIVPHVDQLRLPALDRVSEPGLLSRTIWYAYGFGADKQADERSKAYREWVDANRLGAVFPYRIGHTYPSTVARFFKEFQAHPEYFAMKPDGTRLPFGNYSSLCYSSPGVAALFIQDKLEELETNCAKDPDDVMVSMDPNDGSIECCCERCRALGNGSDQVLYLANQVAEALTAKHPRALVGFYAYASHRLPPEKIQAHPGICVQLAMGFNKTGLTYKELFDQWSAKVSQIGIRDYLGVMAWDWGLPGRGKGASLAYVKEQLPTYAQWHAISYNAEINANWGSFGPAVYVATRLLWDPKASADAAYDDFLRQAFGPSADSMRALYAAWAANQDLSVNNLHEWVTLAGTAWEEGQDAGPGIRSRLVDVMGYLHYAVLFRKWELAEKAGDRDKAYEALRPLLAFTWQTRDREMVHAYALQRRLVNSGAEVLRPLEPGWRFNDAKAVWKLEPLLGDDDVLALYRKDVADYPADTRLRSFPGALVPVPANLAASAFGAAPSLSNAEVQAMLEKMPLAGGSLRGESTWHLLVRAGDPLEVDVTVEGPAGHYAVRVLDDGGSEIWTGQTDRGTDTNAPPVVFHAPVPEPGLYSAVVRAPRDYHPRFSGTMPCVLDVSQRNAPGLRYFGQAYFFVPAGTREILAETRGRLSLSPPGAKLARTDYTIAQYGARECLEIPVGAHDGKVWRVLDQTSGEAAFLNIPPYLAETPARLLVPKSCLE